MDPDEPINTAVAIDKWGLDYVVLTSVDRDGKCYSLSLSLHPFLSPLSASSLPAFSPPPKKTHVGSVLYPLFADMPDGGADHFARTVEELKRL